MIRRASCSTSTGTLFPYTTLVRSPTGALATPACRDAGVPLVIQYHGFDAHDRPVLEEYGELYKESYGYASAVIGVSRDMCRSLEALGCPPEKINYNPYGVALGLFLPVDVGVSPLQFLSLARFAVQNAPPHTVAAFARLHSRYPNARLTMAGIIQLWPQH